MNNNELPKLLEALHQELQQTSDLDEKGRELLRGLDVDIRGLLARTESAPASESPMMQRLQDSVDHFVVTHPALTKLLSDLLTSLSNAGI